MILFKALGSLVVVVGGLLTVGLVTIVGRARVRAGIRRWRRTLRSTWQYVAVLSFVLVVNKIVRVYGPRFSWKLNWNLTTLIHDVEGATVAWIQSIVNPPVTMALSFVYIYGYAFLLVFPVVAYFLLEDDRQFSWLAVTYTLNYAIGALLYTLFVAYGPRNVLPDLVTPLLFSEFPAARLLTNEFNAPTNVFPSLHTSLATSVAILSWLTRDRLPRWPPVAIPMAAAVVFSTTYLGIHWIIDVVGGVLLAAVSVWGARRIVDRSDAQ